MSQLCPDRRPAKNFDFPGSVTSLELRLSLGLQLCTVNFMMFRSLLTKSRPLTKVCCRPFSSGQPASRVIRFLDAKGDIRVGQPIESDANRAIILEPSSTGFFSEYTTTSVVENIAKLLTPVPRPPVVYALGLNYARHAAEAKVGDRTECAFVFLRGSCDANFALYFF